ncbi:MAG: type II toxin-antitoxin system RelE/ParE family toxin [Epsilonproteobacteria bacterium]|nr:type II toxin-antitoxin system RelE/ParE family toxin [Campylobacterota bacterium]
MNIKYSYRFEDEFLEIYTFIAFNSKTQANKFKKELKNSIENIVDMPYKNGF